MADEQTSAELADAGKGAAAGATIGSAFGPVGTVVGGVIGGVVGFVFGMFSGGAAKAARQKTQQANALTLASAEQEQALQRRDLIRQTRIAYATSLAQSTTEGGVSSTGLKGVQGAELSGARFGLSYLDLQASEAVKKFNLLGEAESLRQSAANTQGIFGGLTSLASTFGPMMGGGGSQQPAQIANLNYNASIPASTNSAFTSQFGTFAPGNTYLQNPTIG